MSVPLNLLAVSLLQGEVGFTFMEMWQASGPTAKSTLIVLAIMSAWSIGVMIDRYLAFNAARKQSREFAPLVAGCLQEGKIGEAIDVSEQNQKSHLAKVVIAGLQEYQAAGSAASAEVIESSQRALDRAIAITNSELKRGVAGLATIGSTAPFWGCLERWSALSTPSRGCPHGQDHGSFRGGRRYFRGSDRHSVGTVCGHPRHLDVQLFQWQDGSLRR